MPFRNISVLMNIWFCPLLYYIILCTDFLWLNENVLLSCSKDCKLVQQLMAHADRPADKAVSQGEGWGLASGECYAFIGKAPYEGARIDSQEEGYKWVRAACSLNLCLSFTLCVFHMCRVLCKCMYIVHVHMYMCT